MITYVTRHDFCESFKNLRPSSFTYQGLIALFDYLEDLEDSTGQPIQLDVIELCGAYNEYPNFTEYIEDYNSDLETPEELANQGHVVIPVDFYDKDYNFHQGDLSDPDLPFIVEAH